MFRNFFLFAPITKNVIKKLYYFQTPAQDSQQKHKKLFDHHFLFQTAENLLITEELEEKKLQLHPVRWWWWSPRTFLPAAKLSKCTVISNFQKKNCFLHKFFALRHLFLFKTKFTDSIFCFLQIFPQLFLFFFWNIFANCFDFFGFRQFFLIVCFLDLKKIEKM